MGPEWIVVAIVAVAVIFGVDKLPKMARNVGRAQSEFKKGMREGLAGAISEDDAPAAEAPKTATQPPAAGDLPTPPEV
ncbi:MAG: twin-arginine translocase TatA/TatE family subunit [Actinomycetota bacterium]